MRVHEALASVGEGGQIGGEICAVNGSITLGKGTVAAVDVGNVNGSLGETSVLACLLGGLYLIWRRSMSWQIPVSVLAGAALVAGFANWIDPDTELTVLHHLAPTPSPETPNGRRFLQ